MRESICFPSHTSGHRPRQTSLLQPVREAVSLSSAAADVFVYFGRRLHTVQANDAVNQPTDTEQRVKSKHGGSV